MHHHRFMTLTDRTIFFLVVLLGALLTASAIDAHASTPNVEFYEVETHRSIQIRPVSNDHHAEAQPEQTPSRSPLSILRKALVK